MPTYVALNNFTHQGIQHIKDTTKRADAFKTAAKKSRLHGQGDLLDTGAVR